MTYQIGLSRPITQPIAAWGRSLVVAIVLATASVGLPGLDVEPQPGGMARLRWGAAAWAQDSSVSPEMIMGYATSVLEMDSRRTEAYEQIETLLAGTSYNIADVDMSCTGTANLNQLPRNLRGNIRTIVVNYCNQASDIVETNGLTIREFNQITAAHPQDQALSEQIRTALIQLQQQSQGTPPPTEAPQ